MDVIFIWILLSTFAMSLIAWIGLILVFMSSDSLQKVLNPLIAFSAGSLIGGAFLHLLPEAIASLGNNTVVYVWLIVGFVLFFLLEELLNWLRIKQQNDSALQKDKNDAEFIEIKSSVSYLILIADGLHNFIGGLAIASSFLISIDVGIVTWIAAAAHELPQEIGDFGILVHGGWKKVDALVLNFLSALTIVLGAVIVYFSSQSIDPTFLLPFAAGNFIYIAATDLIPEITHKEALCESPEDEPVLKQSFIYLIMFILGCSLVLATRLIFM